MAISTRLQPRFVFQRLAMTFLCLGCGLWGIYKYQVAIPNDSATAARGAVYRQLLTSLETYNDAEDATPDQRSDALEAFLTLCTDELRKLEGVENPVDANPDVFRPRDTEQWQADLERFREMMVQLNATPRDPQGVTPLPAPLADEVELLRRRVDEAGDVTPPSDFDRVTQWAFILCLPFAPWAFWGYFRQLRRRWTLDSDGTFTGPHGTWAHDDITGVDMDRWMERSVAAILHADGTRAEMDDYVHKGTDLIVGAVAHRYHPEAWTEEAKKVKKGNEPVPAGTGATEPEATEPAPADETTESADAPETEAPKQDG